MLGLGSKNIQRIIFGMLGLGLSVKVKISVLYALKTRKGLCLVCQG